MQKILIIGASARAAAQSAHRAGFEVVAADLFADQDLASFATCLRVPNYPDDFLSIRKQFPDLPVVYTGALENYPSLIEELQTIGPVWGQTAVTLRNIRDPLQWTSALSKRNIACPETQLSLPKDSRERWLAKPLRSAGGANVRRVNETETITEDCLFQRESTGEPCSAAFATSKSNRKTEFLGASRMLVGEPWGSPHEFGYCGSISYSPTAEQKTQWLAIAQALADDFDLVGVFGIDAIATACGIVPIEVNPRYTASMETLEVSLTQPILQYHVDACRGENLNVVEAEFRTCAKLVVFADRNVIMPDSNDELLDKFTTRNQTLADIPTPGQSISTGAPITTVLLKGDEDPDQKLRDTANRLRKSCLSQDN